MAKSDSLRCLLGFHSWQDRRNSEGERFTVCQRCGKEDAWMPTGFGWSMSDR